MSERERIYDERVAPLLLEALKICQEAGMPMVAWVGYDPKGKACGVSKVWPDGSWPDDGRRILLLGAASQHLGIDNIAIGLARHVRKTGQPHSSIVLRSLGVEPDPERRT